MAGVTKKNDMLRSFIIVCSFNNKTIPDRHTIAKVQVFIDSLGDIKEYYQEYGYLDSQNFVAFDTHLPSCELFQILYNLAILHNVFNTKSMQS